MKRIILLAVIGSVLLAAATPGFAHYDAYKANIKEGFSTMANAPRPFIDAIKDEYKAAEFKPAGVIGGFFKGMFYGVKELAVGAIRVLTFNLGTD